MSQSIVTVNCYMPSPKAAEALAAAVSVADVVPDAVAAGLTSAP